MLAGASLLGVLGALIAIPMAAAIQIVLRDWWALRPVRIHPSPRHPPQMSQERNRQAQT